MEQLALWFSENDFTFALYNNFHTDSNIMDYTLRACPNTDGNHFWPYKNSDEIKIFHHLSLFEVIQEAKEFYGVK
jgi:hypothetical protein